VPKLFAHLQLAENGEWVVANYLLTIWEIVLLLCASVFAGITNTWAHFSALSGEIFAVQIYWA